MSETTNPANMPRADAAVVTICIMPLASEIFSERTISGIAPNLAGPNMALWAPIRKTATKTRQMPSISSTPPRAMAPTAIAMITISANLQATIVFRLLKRSLT